MPQSMSKRVEVGVGVGLVAGLGWALVPARATVSARAAVWAWGRRADRWQVVRGSASADVRKAIAWPSRPRTEGPGRSG